MKFLVMATISHTQFMLHATFQKLTIFVLLRLCLADETSNNFPASFIFGDSLVDAGNNNYLRTLSRANYPPNGVDFGGPTGRFTNGRTIADIIGQELGINSYTPPYLAPTTNGPVILKGVNYASGGGGILNNTGKIFGGRLNFDAQLDNFANTRQDIMTTLGAPAAMKLFQDAIFSITMGSNDFINNYLTPVLSNLEQDLVTPEAFVGSMIAKYRIQLTRLYTMGARKMIVVNVGPIGCIPFQREINPTSGDSCVALPNQLAQMFNTRLRSLVTELSGNLEGSKFVYADVYHIVDDIIHNLPSYGFDNAMYACCYVAGKYGGLIPCCATSKICSERSKYVFWDPYHPSDAANSIIARRLMDGDENDIWPMNVRQLASL
ncbi:lipase [Lithospermum erythrorhizon]|uniref:Lipase n=1 Tax=Lithospermum erythrorhizon TaxID=34254 RepID=A0AAV3PA38_LITER